MYNNVLQSVFAARREAHDSPYDLPTTGDSDREDTTSYELPP